MTQMDSRYRVRRSFSIIAHSPDVVELRRGVWNPVSITLSDRTGAGKLAHAIELMDGERTLDDIVRQTRMTIKEATDLVTFLSRHNALETEPENALDYLLGVYRDTLGNVSDARLRHELVQFLGSSPLTDD